MLGNCQEMLDTQTTVSVKSIAMQNRYLSRLVGIAFSRYALVALVVACSIGPITAQTFVTLRSFGLGTNVNGASPSWSSLIQGPDGAIYGTTRSGEANVAGTVFRVMPDGTGFITLKAFYSNSLEGFGPYAGVVLSGTVLFGATYEGGISNCGTVFRLNTDGSDFRVLKTFTGNDGANPFAGLTVLGNTLYGTTRYGGVSSNGTIFKLNTDGSGYNVLKYFSGSDGRNPIGYMASSGGVLYGTTVLGGSFDKGTLFSINSDATGYMVLKHFSPSGPYLPSSLTISGGTLYGPANAGGAYGKGCVFKVNTDGTGFSVLKEFNETDGAQPSGMVAVSGGVLYGTTSVGGKYRNGTVYMLDTSGTYFATLYNFNGLYGYVPAGGVMLSGNVLYGTAQAGIAGHISIQGTVFKLNTDGSGVSAIKSFTYSDGHNPGGLALSGRTLFGATGRGGSFDNGTIFQVDVEGTNYAVIKNFTGDDGSGPGAGLIVSGSMLFGTTAAGGMSNRGTVFSISNDGTSFTTLKNFLDSDGSDPLCLLSGPSNIMYGATYSGTSAASAGNVFKINTDGTGFLNLFSFSSTSNNNHLPISVTLSSNVLYGLTAQGGTSNVGTVFRMNTDGTGYTVLKNFGGADGASPSGTLIATSTELYGLTSAGGGTVFKLNTDGTAFITLKQFLGPDGYYPNRIVLSGGVLYGTTDMGGSFGKGVVFKMKTNGTRYAVLKNFAGFDGDNPRAGLVVTGNALYGTTEYGGDWGFGTLFKINLSVSLTITPLSNATVLSWPGPAFSLQAASVLAGAYTNIPGATSPYTNTPTVSPRFFRLIMN
jgi:uncharacterized repeat protein (TIGR03803 family)